MQQRHIHQAVIGHQCCGGGFVPYIYCLDLSQRYFSYGSDLVLCRSDDCPATLKITGLVQPDFGLCALSKVI